MDYRIATLIWIFSIISVIMSGLGTLASLAVGFDEPNGKYIVTGLVGVFVTALFGWIIWVIYPLTLRVGAA